jgi:uncharacterized membrane protein YgcG
MALQVFGSDSTKLTDILGMRFFNESHPEGVVFDTFSHGGYSAPTFMSNTGSAGPVFAALKFQAAVIHFGSNDVGSESAAQFQADIAAIMARVRTWTANPNFPIILIADVYQQSLSATQITQYDQYVGAELAIAQSDPNVLVINARRLMEDIGWNATSGESAQFLLADGVHYTALAAQRLAAAEISAMNREVRVAECVNDPNSVTLDSLSSIVVSIGGQSACSQYGRFTDAQTLTLNQPNLKVVLTNGFTPSVGQKFQILSWQTLSGTFGTLRLPTLPSSLSWNTSTLYQDGTLKVIPSSPPVISVTSGANQVVTPPASLAPLAFTVAGTGSLSVSATSSNTTLLADSAIAINAGCGVTVTNCSATVTPTSGHTGTTTITLTAADTYGQSVNATTSIQIVPATSSGSGSGGTGSGSGDSGGGSSGGSGQPTSSGGGGAFGLTTLLWLAAMLAGKLAHTDDPPRSAPRRRTQS